MTDRQIDNRVKKLNDLNSQIAELQAQADAIKAELTADLEQKGLDEVATKNFIVRWKLIVSNRFDSKTFQRDHGDLYGKYTKPSAYRRFTVGAGQGA